MKDYPVAEVDDPRLGHRREDYVDIIAKTHDLAYRQASGKPDYWQRVIKADEVLIQETDKLLKGTSHLLNDGGKITPAEKAYAEAMLDGFKMKQVIINGPEAALEKLKNLGYNNKQINDFINTVTQGLKFDNPLTFLRGLNLSENEMQEVEKKFAAYCEENGINGEAILNAQKEGLQPGTMQASASTQYPDEFTDEEHDSHYGPGMG